MNATLQLRQEVQRSAEERDVAADRLAAGKAGDGLVDDRLKDGYGKVRACVAPSLMRGWISVLANTPQRAAMG